MKLPPTKIYILYKKVGSPKWFCKVFFDEITVEGFLDYKQIRVEPFFFYLYYITLKEMLEAMHKQEPIEFNTEEIPCTETDKLYNNGEEKKLVFC